MPAYWIHFSHSEDGKDGCVRAKDIEAAKELAFEFGDVEEVFELPYPAFPVLACDGTWKCPPFCWRPEECKGRRACPRQIACSE